MQGETPELPVPMRILFAHNEYGRPSGEEDAIRTLATLLQSGGHEVQWFLRSSAEIKGFAGKINAFFSGLYSFESARAMRAALRENRPDLVQVQNIFPFLSPSILEVCHEAGVPVVMRCPNYRLFCPNGLHLSHGEICERCLGGREYWCVLRNCESNYFKSVGYALRSAVARLRGTIPRTVSVLVVLSDFAKQRFIQGGIEPERIEILPNVAPVCDLNTDRSERSGDLVTFVGRPSSEKGIEDFLAAARALPHLSFAVAGGGERALKMSYNSPANVKWLGFLTEEQLNLLYARSRLLVFPFRWFEGFPNVLTRAMAMEKPVVASRIGAIPEIVIDRETGLLFEPGNIEELVSCIAELHSDSERCRELGRAGRERALAQYSREEVYAKLVRIYAKAMCEQNFTHRRLAI